MRKITTDFYRCRPIRPFKLLYFITPHFSIYEKNIQGFAYYRAYYVKWFKWELELKIEL